MTVGAAYVRHEPMIGRAVFKIDARLMPLNGRKGLELSSQIRRLKCSALVPKSGPRYLHYELSGT